MKKHIEIQVLRISPNGELIEFIANCPDAYHFTEFTITPIKEDGSEGSKFSIAESLGFTSTGSDIEEIEGAINISEFNLKPDDLKIFKITLEAVEDGHSKLEALMDDTINIIDEIAYISDVHGAYHCLMDDIVSFDAECSNTALQDRVIRNYLMVYAHQEALKLHYVDDAVLWYKKIQNCFGNCRDNQFKPLDCGCHK